MNITKLPKDPTVLYALELNSIELMNYCLLSKELNRKICENENFWQEKFKRDFKNYEKPENKTYKEWYYRLAYDSLVLYIGSVKVANRVKKVVLDKNWCYYLTVFGELYTFMVEYDMENGYYPINIGYVRNNVLDLSKKLILTNDKKCYKLDDVSHLIASNVKKLISDEFYETESGHVWNNDILLGMHIVSAYKWDLRMTNNIYSCILYVTDTGQLKINKKNFRVGELKMDFELIQNDVVYIEKGVKDFKLISIDEDGLKIFLDIIDKDLHLYHAAIVLLFVDIDIIDVIQDSFVEKSLSNDTFLDIEGNLHSIQDGIIYTNVIDADIYIDEYGQNEAIIILELP